MLVFILTDPRIWIFSCIVFSSSDVDALQKVCAKRTLEGAKLSVSKVTISNSVIVKGLKPRTSRDTVWYYFEGKRSGNMDGVEVDDVQMKTDEGYALVFFKDHAGKI